MVPREYQRATEDFVKFLQDARDAAGVGSTHQAYTMTQAVFQAFRRRLDIAEAIRFSQVLPVCLRALFVDDWDTAEPRLPFEGRTVMTKEVWTLRPDHNVNPETAIQDVAHALRKNVDETAFNLVLTRLPVGANEFWKVFP